MDTKTVKIMWNGKEEDVVIKKFEFGEKLSIQDQSNSIKTIGGVQTQITSYKTMVELALVYGIKSAPFNVNINVIRKLPSDVGEDLYSKIDKFNTTSLKKNSKLETHLEEEVQATQN